MRWMRNWIRSSSPTSVAVPCVAWLVVRRRCPRVTVSGTKNAVSSNIDVSRASSSSSSAASAIQKCAPPMSSARSTRTGTSTLAARTSSPPKRSSPTSRKCPRQVQIQPGLEARRRAVSLCRPSRKENSREAELHTSPEHFVFSSLLVSRQSWACRAVDAPRRVLWGPTEVGVSFFSLSRVRSRS